MNTTRQVGGAIGLAALATVAGSVTAHTAVHQPHVTLTAGYRSAFTVSSAIVAATTLLVLLLTRRPGTRTTTAPTRPAFGPRTPRTSQIG
ncbi:hypothetical protein [Streptomyces sp. MMG1121]|uniref:hypothetical protein n=1 Tax=Streptomyces sp. MMG1121 TaxID=1415544 RepID=UPI000B014398|nr:hypothetical protein [Streptomyces sp. MMG1121]